MIQGVDVVISTVSEFRYSDMVILGNHVSIDFGFYCSTKLDVGDYVHISPHVSVIGGKNSQCVISDFCFVSTGSRLICASEKFLGDGLVGPLIPAEYRDQTEAYGLMLERFSGVCANSVVMPGATLAEGSVLGANSLLKTSTEPWTIYAGSPAKPIKKRNSAKIIEYAKRMGYE